MMIEEPVAASGSPALYYDRNFERDAAKAESERLGAEFERLQAFARSDEPATDLRRSHEYGSLIIHSMATGVPRVVYGNMPNRKTISNLPACAIAEAPTLVDRNGCQFTTVGELPPQPGVVEHAPAVGAGRHQVGPDAEAISLQSGWPTPQAASERQ